jgi:hypothetical protein
MTCLLCSEVCPIADRKGRKVSERGDIVFLTRKFSPRLEVVVRAALPAQFNAIVDARVPAGTKVQCGMMARRLDDMKSGGGFSSGGRDFCPITEFEIFSTVQEIKN